MCWYCWSFSHMYFECVGLCDGDVFTAGVAGPSGSFRPSLGAAAGWMDRDLPIRLQGRTRDGARACHHSEVCHDRSGYQEGGVHLITEPATPANDVGEIWRVPAEGECRVLYQLCREPECGEFITILDSNIDDDRMFAGPSGRAV